MAESKLETIKRQVKRALEATRAQREREREDLAFQVSENQWSEEAKAERKGGVMGGIVVPPRPMLSVSLLHQPMQLVQNMAATAHLGVNLHPVSEKANEDLAEVKQGLYKRIQRDGQADLARMWGLDRAKQCGLGWYRVNTKWDEDGDSPFDQEIVFDRILYQEMVYMDPSAQKADFSDARWGGLAIWMSVDEFRDEFPDAEYPGSDTAFEELAKNEPEWVKGDGDKRAVLVVEHFYKVFDREEVKVAGRVREKVNVSVKVCKATAWAVLEETNWDGRYIPLIPVVGRELQPIDGERRWEGMVRPVRDAQQVHNHAASTLVERMSLEPKTPFIGAEGQFEGHEAEWQQANRRNLAYIEYKPTTIGDKPAPPPQRAQIDQSGMSLAILALQESKSWIQSATAVYEPSLGEAPKRKDSQSGRAILALQQQTDAGTSHYINNLATITLPYEALVVMDLMPAIYDRPGRVTQVLGGEDDTEMVMLGQPYTMDQRTGRPVPAQEGQPGAKSHNLDEGKYTISVSVGKSYQTRLEEGSAEIGAILEARPELMPLVGATYFRFRDFPGAKEIADILKKVRDSQYPMLNDDQQGYVTPEQLEVKVQTQGQQLQLMQAQLQAAMKALETDQAKQQATLAKTQMEIASRERIAAADNETKLAIEGLAQRMEALIALQSQAHETAEHHKDMAHDVAMAAAGGQTFEYSAEKGQNSEQGQENETGSEREASREESAESGVDGAQA